MTDGELTAFGALADYKRRLLNHLQKLVRYKEIYKKDITETKKNIGHWRLIINGWRVSTQNGNVVYELMDE